MAGIPNNIVSILAVDNAGATTVIDIASFLNSVQPSIPIEKSISAQPIVQNQPPSSAPPIVTTNNITTAISILADPNVVPKVNASQDNLINSIIYELNGRIGLNTKAPKYTLDVRNGSINLTPSSSFDGYKISDLNIAYTDLSVATKEAIVMGNDTTLKRVSINTLLLRGLIPTTPLGSKRMVAIDDYGIISIAVAGVDYQGVIGYVPADAATTLTINGVSYNLYADRTWSVGTVTSVAALTITASGTDVTSTVLTPSTTPVITLNIPSASTTNRGVLTSADWTTFNNKQAALSGTGFVKSTAGTISYDTNTYYLASNPSNYISGNQSITLSGDVSGTGTTAITTTLATVTQASTGNFVKVTLDTKGRVTGNTAVLASDITTALTYTPVTNARTLTINGVTYDLTADRSWTINIGSSARNIIKFTATAGQTTFTITGGYSVGLIDVYLNGARLSGTDYTASNGTTVVLASGVVAGDIVETVSYTSYAASSISGAGTTGYITKWTGSSAQGNSIIQDSGTAITIGGNTTATAFIKSGGTSAQFLKADGSVDSSTYLTGITSGQVTTALGYTPVTNARTLTINGTAYDLTADRSWTITAGVSGSGTTNYVAKFTGTSALGNSIIIDNGTAVGIGTTAPNTLLGLKWTAAASSVLDIQNASATGASAIDFYTNAGTYMGNIGGATSHGKLTVDSWLGGISLRISGTEKLKLDTSGYLVYTPADATDWYFKGPANGPTIRMKYSAGTANRSGALGWADNTPTYSDVLAWTSSSLISYSDFTLSKATPYITLTNTGTGTSGQIYQSGNDLFIKNSTSGWLYLANNKTVINGALDVSGNTVISLDVTARDMYISGWYRNNTSGQGLYNQAVANHFYATDANSWNIAATGSYPRLWLRDGYGGTSKLALYSDTSGSGMLNSSSYWAIRANYGSAYMGGVDLFGPVGFRPTLDYNGEVAGGMKMITHSINKVGSSKFLKIYAGINNYFTGFIFGFNFDNYPPNSATNTGAGFSYQFGGWSDGSGSHGDKYFDLTHFGGNNVGNMGREMNTDGNGYILTTPTSTGAGGYKVSATIMIFARDMSQLSFTYY